MSAGTDRPADPLQGSAGLTLAVTSSAATPCLRPTGFALTVTSGADRIWSSEDCSALEPAEPPQTVPPGRTVLHQLTWDVTRSRPGCPGGLPALRPGTYVVSGRLGQLDAAGKAFRLG